MKFLPNTEPIIFEEKAHKYFTQKGQELISASTIIHLYSPPFDPTGEILINKARKEGITPEELQKQWDYERDSACERGTQFHKEVEYWIETKEFLKDSQYQDLVQLVIDEIEFKGNLRTETILYSEKLGIAGTIDLLDEYDAYTVDIQDWKTNKALKFKSFFKKGSGYQMMLPPVQHLMDCNFIHYSLQLAVYELLLEENGYWVNEKVLNYIDLKKRNLTRYEVFPMRKEAEAIIKHYQENKPKH